MIKTALLTSIDKLLLVSFLNILLLTFSTSSKAQGSGNALFFDGNYGYVQSSTSNRGITNQVTLEAWINTTTTKYQWVAGKYDRYGAERGYHLIIKDGNAALAGRDGSGVYRNSGYSRVNVSDGKWHHLAGVCDGSKWSIYVDGILQNSITTNYSYTSLVNNAPFAIGKYFVYDDEFYEGQIDEVRVWKKALTEDEIRQKMCSKLTSFPPELVGYFNFDATGSGTTKDLSSLKLDGTLQSMNPLTAWVTSGAPIGDRSVYRYTNRWDSSLEMVTDYANFSVIKVDPAINGFHLYSIQSPPASKRGIGSPQEVKEYYGLFKVGDANRKYKVYFKQYGMACGGNLFRRLDNTVSNWSLVADTTGSPNMLYNSSANYGEFAATSKAAPTVKISGPTSICSATTATLTSSYTGSGKIVWNTGETSTSIKINKSGTYTVELTNASGCTAKDEIQVSFTKEPVTSLPTEVFTCYGEAVIIDATAEGATYKWSSGHTTPSIAVSTPATYYVTITINDCSYVKEVIVSNDECPVIPNIITPNDDGKNDLFVVQGVEPNLMELKVYNRWGKSVYQNDDYDNSWSASALAAGTYFYHFTSRRSQKVYKGWVEVVR